MASSWRGEFRTSLETPGWALRFFLQQLHIVLPLSLIPATLRFIVVGGWPTLPQALEWVLEALVLAARIGLIVFILHRAVRLEPDLWRLDRGEAAERARAFARRHGRSLWLQLALFVLFGAAFKYVPEVVVPERYTPIVLALKNVTVIPFTMIWVVGAIRQLRVGMAGQGAVASAQGE